MTQPKQYKNESQDARRHDQHHATHPDEGTSECHEKTVRQPNQHRHSKHTRKK